MPAEPRVSSTASIAAWSSTLRQAATALSSLSARMPEKAVISSILGVTTVAPAKADASARRGSTTTCLPAARAAPISAAIEVSSSAPRP